MSEIKRYRMWPCTSPRLGVNLKEDVTGDVCKHSEVITLESENARLKGENEKIKQDNEKLMKIVRNVAHVQITKENIKDARQIIREDME